MFLFCLSNVFPVCFVMLNVIMVYYFFFTIPARDPSVAMLCRDDTIARDDTSYTLLYIGSIFSLSLRVLFAILLPISFIPSRFTRLLISLSSYTYITPFTHRGGGSNAL